MARIRLNILENKDYIVPHETTSIYDFININIDKRYHDYLTVYVNYEIEDNWERKVTTNDDLYIIVIPKDKNTLRTAIVIGAIVATGAVLPASTPVWASVGIKMGTAYMAGKLSTALIPIDEVKLPAVSAEDFEQTFYFTGQSNSVKTYGVTPRIYGIVKAFPNVAANPYIDLEVDRETGELVQVMHVIYDFGIGQYNLRELSIGDTSISKFFDVFYNITYTPNFIFYKQDVYQENLSINLNKNAVDAGVYPEEYSATRTICAERIKLLFHFTSGLISYGTDSSKGDRNVQLQIFIKKQGTTDWIPYYQQEEFTIQCPHSASNINTVQIQDYSNGVNIKKVYGQGYYNEYGMYVRKTYYYFKAGSTQIGNFSGVISINDKFYAEDGGFLGNIVNISNDSTITLDRPLPRDILIYIRSTIASESSYSGFYAQRSNLLVITAKDPKAFFLGVDIKLPEEGVYDVKVIRHKSWGAYNYSINDNMSWIGLTSYKDNAPITTSIPHTFLELKIKATGQLNGTVNTLNAIVESDVSSNPADILHDLLTNQYINKNYITDDKIDLNSLEQWRNFCDEIPPNGTKKRYSLNFVLNTNTTLKEMINKVCSSALASFTFASGKYGVIIDKQKIVPVQLFTERNVRNIGISKSFAEIPESVKVVFKDSSLDYESRDVVVERINDPTKFETINAFGVTNAEQAHRVGLYYLLQASLRREIITFETDFEHLACTRGDYVLFQSQVMKAGGFPVRVKSISGNTIELDTSIEAQLNTDYQYVFRNVNGIDYGICQFTNSTHITTNDTLPAVGDLIVIGELDKVAYDCIVKSIEPMDEYNAKITLVEKADAIYDALDNGTIPPYTPIISNFAQQTFAPDEVRNLTSNAGWECSDIGYYYYIDLIWEAPLNSVVDVYEIYKATESSNYELVTYTSNTSYRYEVKDFKLHKFKVLGVSPQGEKLNLSNVSHTEVTSSSKTTPPSDVSGLYLNILSETIQFSWERVLDCDIKRYMIRYSPSTTASWESSIPLLSVDSNLSMASVQARTGSYFIKAIDWNNNESINASKAITSIPELRNINIITETNDFPDLDGAKDKTEKKGDELYLLPKTFGVGGGLTEYYSEGSYVFKNLLDLGEIYTVRLQSLVEAEGFSDSDLMSSWSALSDILQLSSSTVSDWDVITQYRATNQLVTMATWTRLSDVTYLDSGVGDNWTEWRDFTIGDFTGRIFQFRLKLKSYKPSITPRVFNGIIRADMPDRIESYDNMTVPDSGLTIVYDPSFKGPEPSPVIQITQDNAQDGDYYEIINKTLEGFTIKFYNNGVSVTRQIDIMIKGYGRKNTEVL